MTTYDWIVVGAGITGASLAYELSQYFRVLLLEKDAQPDNATVYSYGGLAYWSGTNELTRQLGQEGLELHRHLSSELEAETEFRELDLILTIARQDDPEAIAQLYNRFEVVPELINVADACVLEPLLNPNAISGVLKLPHGHIHPQKTTDAYVQAFIRNGGEIVYERAVDLVWHENQIAGVITETHEYSALHTVVCAGGLSRSLLQQANLSVAHRYTIARSLVTPPVDLELATIVMPAIQQRFTLEAQSDLGSTEFTNDTILDPGAVQFLDGSLCLGQISSVAQNLDFQSLAAAEAEIRDRVGNILPLLEDIPATCHNCLVAYNNLGIALVGNLANLAGLYLFSGFTSTLVYAPVLARRFARSQAGTADPIIEQLQLILDSAISN